MIRKRCPCATSTAKRLSLQYQSKTLSSKSSSSFSIPRANEEHTLSTSTASPKGNRNDESHSFSEAFTNNPNTDHCSSTRSELFPWKILTEVELNAFYQRQDSSLLPGWGNAFSHRGIRTSGGNRIASIGGLGLTKTLPSIQRTLWDYPILLMM